MGFDTAGFLARILRLSLARPPLIVGVARSGVHAAGQDRAFRALRGRAFGDYWIMVLGHANPSVLPDRRVTVPRNWWQWNSEKRSGPERGRRGIPRRGRRRSNWGRGALAASLRGWRDHPASSEQESPRQHQGGD